MTKTKRELISEMCNLQVLLLLASGQITQSSAASLLDVQVGDVQKVLNRAIEDSRRDTFKGQKA